MLMRFVIGRTSNGTQETELTTESKEHGGFLRLDLEVRATVMMWSKAIHFDADSGGVAKAAVAQTSVAAAAAAFCWCCRC